MKTVEKLTKLSKELESKYNKNEVYNQADIKKHLEVYNSDKITILFTEKFEIVYFTKTNKIHLRTTYSNQEINKEYYKEFEFLYNLVIKANNNFETC